MIKAASFALHAGGLLSLILGRRASNELSSDVSRLFTGSVTGKAAWMLTGGFVGIASGLVGLLRVSRGS